MNSMHTNPGDVDANSKHAPLVVGIGASAGGLDALERFFSHVPAESGLIYVVIQHLAPHHVSMLAQLIGRHTQMPVVEASDGTRAEVDHVYVIQPGTLLGITGGSFCVTTIGVERHGQIDAFLRTLAEDQGDRAVGIILSGSGTDGTEGLRAIKAHGGLSLAQAPETATYPNMPKSAIDAHVVDRVVRVDEMPELLLERARRVSEPRDGGPTPPTSTVAPAPAVAIPAAGATIPSDDELAESIDRICELVQRATGHDFSHYKRGTVLRRLRRRVQQRGSSSMADYIELLGKDAQEPELLAKDLLIGVTHFFRDPEAFKFLEQHVVPQILSSTLSGEGVRIWVPGCASGEEAYSIAILLRERLAGVRAAPPVQIFGTDIDSDAIVEARQARYPAEIAQHVSSDRLARFFTRDDSSYLVGKAVREMCIFSEHSLIRDPPFLGLDLISCRNVLIYLNADLQEKLVPLFHYALKRGGYLFLGPSEGLTGHPELFDTLDKRFRVFRRVEPLTRPAVNFPFTGRMAPRISPPAPLASAAVPAQQQSVNTAFERLVLQEYAPPSAVVNGRGDVICVAGLTGRYLQPPAGILTTNILDITHSSLRIELRTALHTSSRTGKKVVRSDVQVDVDGSPRRLRLTVRPLPGVKQQDLFAVVLEDRAGISEAEEREPSEVPAQGTEGESAMEQLESELRSTRANLRATIEELESANEELKSSNEELLSTNEEMQSANEELQSSQEELKSVNEELSTVNTELGRKVDELAQANSDLQNLFSSTDIATLFLDAELRFTRFTPAAKKLFRLIEADVGRPLSDLAPRFVDLDLDADVREVLRTLRPLERQVETVDGHSWYLVRIFPYRTVENVIAGAVITLADITRVERAKQAVRASEEKYRTLFQSIDEGLCVIEVLFDAANEPRDFRYLEVNPAFEKQTGIARAIGRTMREIAPEHEEHWFQAYGQVARTGEPMRFERPAMALERYYDVYAFRIGAPEQRQVAVLFSDITERKRGEIERERVLEELRDAQKQLSADLDGMSRILKVGAMFLEEGHLESVLGEIVDAAIAITGADFGNIQLIDAAGDLKIVAQRGFSEQWLNFWDDVRTGQGACGTALERKERVIIEDVEQSPVFQGKPALEVQREACVRAVQSSPIIGRGGEPLGMLSTHYRKPWRPDSRELRLIDLLVRQVADIIEWVQGEAVRLTNARLIEADRRKNEFIGMLSHELRNPLAAMRNSIHILDSAAAGTEQALRAQAVLHRQIDHLTRLVEDLLDITRLTSGKFRLQRETLDLDELAQRVVEDYRPAFDEAGIALHTRASPSKVWVSGDRTRLSQAIGNLLQNVLKFTPRGGEATVSVARSGGQAMLRVEDTGLGIAPEILPRLFEPFTQADRTLERSRGGLGLGLAVVKGLLELHGGTIRAASEGPGKGAQFTISLPLEAAGPPEVPSEPSPSAEVVSRRVLIIEDNRDAADTLHEALELSGHVAAVAETGSEGIDMVRTFKPDVVLCDIGLPGMNGYEVARALRKDPALAPLTLIALSGYAGSGDIEKSMQAGFDRHLVKPIGIDALIRVLAESGGEMGRGR